jgi:hypothetical protein
MACGLIGRRVCVVSCGRSATTSVEHDAVKRLPEAVALSSSRQGVPKLLFAG